MTNAAPEFTTEVLDPENDQTRLLRKQGLLTVNAYEGFYWFIHLPETDEIFMVQRSKDRKLVQLIDKIPDKYCYLAKPYDNIREREGYFDQIREIVLRAKNSTVRTHYESTLHAIDHLKTTSLSDRKHAVQTLLETFK